MSTVKAFEAALGNIELSGAFAEYLKRAIDHAMNLPAPPGDPTAIAGSPPGEGGVANYYGSIGRTADHDSIGLSTVANSSIHQVWRGLAAEKATDAIAALGAQANGVAAAFEGGCAALTTWAQQLADAQRRDEQGRGLLIGAKSKLGDTTLDMTPGLGRSDNMIQLAPIVALAREGCNGRLTAAKMVDSAASDAAETLNQLAAAARSRQINSPHIDPLTSVVLAYSSDFGWTDDPLNTILTPNGLARASQALNGMSAGDRTAFENMLKGAKSPQEAAYLWKALGAGNSLDAVRQFDAVIHQNGDKLKWLSQHLDPQVNDTNLTTGAAGKHTLNYMGQTKYLVPVPDKPGHDYNFDFYNQNTTGDQNAGDCVAASTVVARAANDPAFMLGLTTGQGPQAASGANPGDDSAKAFKTRLEQTNQTNFHPNSIDPVATDNTLLSRVAGSSYQSTPLDTADQRRAELPKIEAAVTAGKPVSVEMYNANGSSGHQGMILAAHGDELEIYNPWGFTEWVTNDQFINGQLGELTRHSPEGGLPIPTSVALPQ